MSGTGAEQPNISKVAALNSFAFRKNLPFLINTINKYAVPTAQAQLAAQQATLPQYTDLQNQLLRSSGLAAGDLQAELLNTSGRQQAQYATEIDRAINPEFYAAREAGLSNLLGNLSRLNPDSASAQQEAERLVNQENARTGNLTAPANGTNTVANALQFGDERLKRISALDKALNTATNFMSSSRATFDPFGRSVGGAGAQNNTSQFTGDATKQNTALGSDLLNNIFGYTNTKANADARQQTYVDRIGDRAGY